MNLENKKKYSNLMKEIILYLIQKKIGYFQKLFERFA